ncbi:MAG: type II secretion system protein [Pseudomonadota bacterium]
MGWRVQRRHTLRGFTMVELLVAFVLIGTTLAALSQVQSTSSRSARIVSEKTADVWRDQSAAAAFVHATGSRKSTSIEANVSPGWQDAGFLTEQEAARLAQRGWRLRLLTLRSQNGAVVWQGATLVPVQEGEP